jgi:hypothetical protein
MRVSIPVVLTFALFIVLAGFFLPVRVRFRAAGRPGDFALRVSVRLPLLPVYLPLPRASGVIGKRLSADTGAALRPSLLRQDERRDERRGEGQDEKRDERRDEGRAGGDNRERRTLTETLKRMRNALAVAQGCYSDFREAITLILRAVTFDKVRIIAKAGTGDAYETAMLCGAINALAGIGLSVARRQGTRFRKKPLVRVDPVFEGACFFFSIDLETSFTLARASYVAGKVTRALWAIRPTKESLALSSQKSVEY